MQRWTLIITGRVQGVFFRKGTAEAAKRLDVSGYVRNRPDNSVEIIAEGDKDQLVQLRDWCWEGPPKARVDDIEVLTSDATGEFDSFVIRH